jgi:predicted nucleotidyltransferase
MTTIQELEVIVYKWAVLQPRVSAAYLFGSRVKGTNGVNSDIDVAIELLSPKGQLGNFCDWAELAKGFRQTLGDLLPVKLDLCHYENSTETLTVHNGLIEASICVYSNKKIS